MPHPAPRRPITAPRFTPRTAVSNGLRPTPRPVLPALLTTLLTTLLTAACTTAVMPRTADIAPPGHIAGEFALPVAYATATARGRFTDPDTGATEPVTVTGLSTAQLNAPLALMIMPAWPALALRLGLFTPCEIGVLASLFGQGGELRCGLVQQPRGDPFSLALAAAALYQPLFDEPDLYRVGLDASYGDRSWQLTFGAHAQYGTTVHHIAAVPARFTRQSDHHTSPVVFARRRGWRLTLPLGVILAADQPIGGILGVVPYISLDETPRALECRQCPAVHLTDFREDWGIVFTAGMRFGGEVY